MTRNEVIAYIQNLPEDTLFSANLMTGEFSIMTGPTCDPYASLKLRAQAMFGKRPSTPWDKAERTAWKTAAPIIQQTSEEDWQLLEWFYGLPKEETYARKALAQLLNNWNGEISKAHAYAQTCKPKLSSEYARF